MADPAVIHCANCATQFRLPRPLGRILFDTDGDAYHFAGGVDPGEWGHTVCGIPREDFSDGVGTFGVEISEIELTSWRLLGKRACPKCFAAVW